MTDRPTKGRYPAGIRSDGRAMKAVPRASIEWLVDRMHVGTSDAAVEADIRARCASHPGWTAATTAAAVRIALRRHAANRATYRTVMYGL